MLKCNVTSCLAVYGLCPTTPALTASLVSSFYAIYDALQQKIYMPP